MEQVQHHLVLQHALEERNIVEQDHHLAVLYQADIIQLDVTHQEITVQDKVSVQQEITVQMVYLMHVEQESIVEQEQQDVQI